MDIYNLINSKAISEHCRKIKIPFKPLYHVLPPI